jgi:putative membrane protein
LVFRTNTAYDRWWEARKIIASMEANMAYMTLSFANGISFTQTLDNDGIRLVHNLNEEVFNYLKGNSKKIFKVKNLFHELKSAIISRGGSDVGNMDRKLTELIDQFAHLKRIKHTPIPLSYTFHIKVSIFVYLLSLPFGLLYGMGLMSIFLVMLLYFVIAGIEIISNEIEDPFHGDPNDLPLDELMSDITYMCSLPDPIHPIKK